MIVTTSDLTRTLDQVAENLKAESGIVIQESDRVKALIADAVQLMSESFHNMHRLATDQARLTSDLVNQPDSQTLDQLVLSAQSTLTEIAESTELIIAKPSDLEQKLELINARVDHLEQVSKQSKALSSRLNEASQQSNTSDTKSQLVSFADESSELSDRFEQEMNETKALVEELKSSVKRATAEAFGDVLAAKDRLELQLKDIFDATLSLNQQFKSIVDIGDEISYSVQSAVRSLQFEDMASQALSSLSHNATSLVNLATDLRGVVDENGNIDMQALAELEENCRKVIDEIQQRNAGRTVSQDSMDDGEIELF